MVDHHLVQCKALNNVTSTTTNNVPRIKPKHDLLGHYGGLLEVMPHVEELLDILDTDYLRRKRKLQDISRLPAKVYWEDGIETETTEVLEKYFKIK